MDLPNEKAREKIKEIKTKLSNMDDQTNDEWNLDEIIHERDVQNYGSHDYDDSSKVEVNSSTFGLIGLAGSKTAEISKNHTDQLSKVNS